MSKFWPISVNFGPSGCRTLMGPVRLPALAPAFREISILSPERSESGPGPQKWPKMAKIDPRDQKSTSEFDPLTKFWPWDQKSDLDPQILSNWSKFFDILVEILIKIDNFGQKATKFSIFGLVRHFVKIDFLPNLNLANNFAEIFQNFAKLIKILTFCRNFDKILKSTQNVDFKFWLNCSFMNS